MIKLPNGLSWRAIISFFVSLILCGFLISSTIINKQNIKKMEIEQRIMEKSLLINEIFAKLLYKTQALAGIILQGNGDVDDFNQIAPAIVADDHTILNVLLAPDGIVSRVYPLRGNEGVIGLNFLGEGPAGNKEAMLARDLGNLVLSGPFNLIQGGEAIAGRMPVYIDTPDEKHRFWGLVSVTLKFPQVLEDANLDTLKTQGFVYELWRVNPDSGKRQIIAHNAENTPKTRYIEGNINILNAAWYLRVWPSRAWYTYPDNMILIIVGFFISCLVLFVIQNNFELRQMKTIFERMAKVDPVTGIFNRRYMDENLKRIISTLSRSNGTLSLLMVDVDLFKNYNDNYGHTKGDACLKAIAEVLKTGLLRADDFVVRYGGEEFVVVLPNTGESGARKVANRLLEAMRERKIMHETSNVEKFVTISIGATTGIVQHTNTGDDYIKRADKAMYMSKQNGRNQYTFLTL